MRNKASKDVKVAEIMTERSKLMTVDPNHTTMDAMTMMIKHNFRHVPVVSPLMLLLLTTNLALYLVPCLCKVQATRACHLKYILTDPLLATLPSPKLAPQEEEV